LVGRKLTASRARASVTGLLALLVATLAKVISASVDNDGTAEDALGADQLDELVGDGALGVALSIGLEVAQVTNVALVILGGTVGLAVRVDCQCMSTCFFLVPLHRLRTLTVRAGGSAAIGVVTEGVNVHTTLSVGVVAGDVPGDGGVSTFGGLLEGDGTGDLRVSTEDGNCKACC
jgi:hypothetical protein